jgi:RNA polymerase sigma-70 factor (ECF subfamily)
MINCKKVQELLSEYLDDELKDVICGDIQKHLDDCPDCLVQVDSVKQVIRLYREATDTECPVDIQIRLQDVLKKARDEGTQGRSET